MSTGASLTLTGLPWHPAPVTVPTRSLSGAFFHQGPTRHPVDSCADPASVSARYQTKGGPGVWYGSSKERGAWAELLRHWANAAVSPFEMRRRVGRVTVTAQVVDLTDPAVQALLTVTPNDLVGNDYSRCQAIAQAVFTAGGAGLISPSAAMPGCTTVAIFARSIAASVTPAHSRIQRPPATLFNHIQAIPLIGPEARQVAVLFHRLRAQHLRDRTRRR